MPVFDSRSFQGHENIMFCSDKATGLKAIIAVHSTALGPAVGGTRFRDYVADHRTAPTDVAETRGEEDAVYDLLRLSRGMSLKNAMAGLRLGGGKSVIMGDPKKVATPELMQAFGRSIDRLGGTYHCAEDVGTSPALMEHVAKATNYVCGLDGGPYATGDPSPHTALGVFVGIQSAVRHKMGTDSLDGLTVTIQGVGHVGQYLVKHLLDAGAKVRVADISTSNLEATKALGDVEIVSPDGVHADNCDVFAPCALGGVINRKTVGEIKAKIVAGAANNVLEDERSDDEALRRRGILYAPDYVINAGGIISVESEVYREKLENAVREGKVRRIGETLSQIFERAEKEERPTGIISNEMAERIIEDAKERKLAAE